LSGQLCFPRAGGETEAFQLEHGPPPFVERMGVASIAQILERWNLYFGFFDGRFSGKILKTPLTNLKDLV
jgi:hypothetical protein